MSQTANDSTSATLLNEPKLFIALALWSARLAATFAQTLFRQQKIDGSN